ncbi:MAG: AraC-like transcriptional [Desulfovibrionaceae bacterium]|nr:MAG: AraC-like transcriptional [Desulfovibrionaceae bacterium]
MNTDLITSVGLPVVAQVIEASEQKNYLGLMLQLDQRLIAHLMVERDLPQPRKEPTRRGMATGEMTPQLLNAFIRLEDLLDNPDGIPILASLVQREILYRLKVGEQGERLRQIASAGSHSNQIARAIDWLKSNCNQSFRVDDFAGHAGMIMHLAIQFGSVDNTISYSTKFV